MPEEISDVVDSYALAITSGAAPSANLDTSFMESLGLQGFVPVSGRGTVTGSYSGVLSGQPVTIGFKVSSSLFVFPFFIRLTYDEPTSRTRQRSTGQLAQG
jgi:hypothetical protein